MNRVVEITFDEYHKDQLGVPTPSLSHSAAHTLLTKSPAHCWLEHPRFGNLPCDPTREMDEGTLIHTLLLNKGKDIAIIDAPDWRKSAVRDDRDAARAKGMIPILKHRYENARVAALQVEAHLYNLGIVLDGHPEQMIAFESPTTDGQIVQCRAMLDHWRADGPDKATIYEIKKVYSGHPDAIKQQIVRMGFDLQFAAYMDAMEAISKSSDLVDFIFIGIEIDPPYAVTPFRLSDLTKELGRAKWQRAKDIWHNCLIHDIWPNYTDHILELEPPLWAFRDFNLPVYPEPEALGDEIAEGQHDEWY